MYTWVSIKSISISIYVENEKWCSVSILGYFFLFFLLFKTFCLPMFLLFRGYLIWIIFLGARLIQTLDDRSSIIKWMVIAVIYDQNNPDITIQSLNVAMIFFNVVDQCHFIKMIVMDRKSTLWWHWSSHHKFVHDLR
jgi:hypothetical protein